MREVIGWEEGDSILAPGGSISNMYAVIIARHKQFPEHKQKGMRTIPAQLICYTSKHSHYSLKGAASTVGLGLDNCREVPVDSRGRMDPSSLRKIIEEDNIWLHIDAAWGGGLLMSKTHRPSRFAGVERADSLTWNPHKLMGTLLQCSTFHLREKGILADCNTMA